MLLKRDKEDDLILYDDHGEAWMITLISAGVGGRAVPPPSDGSAPARAIRFLGRDDELFQVPYDGGATSEDELDFDEVVVHFLRAQD